MESHDCLNLTFRAKSAIFRPKISKKRHSIFYVFELWASPFDFFHHQCSFAIYWQCLNLKKSDFEEKKFWISPHYSSSQTIVRDHSIPQENSNDRKSSVSWWFLLISSWSSVSTSWWCLLTSHVVLCWKMHLLEFSRWFWGGRWWQNLVSPRLDFLPFVFLRIGGLFVDVNLCRCFLWSLSRFWDGFWWRDFWFHWPPRLVTVLFVIVYFFFCPSSPLWFFNLLAAPCVLITYEIKDRDLMALGL